jgi:hypothetical protein
MLELFFFILGIVNSVLLIAIFIVRKIRLEILSRYGWIYLLLATPAIAGVILAIIEQKTVQYIIFLGIFLAFLLVEGIYDFVLKIPFREKTDWRWLTPYLVLYYAMNYGFIVMPWKYSLVQGLIMLVLFIIQLMANLTTHPFKAKSKSSKTI